MRPIRASLLTCCVCLRTPERSKYALKASTIVPYRTPEGKMILIGEKGFCQFLRNGLCTIHEYKPVLCRLYPFYPVEKKVLEGLLSLPGDVEVVKHGSEEYVFIFDEECPGVGEGDPVDFKGLLEAFLAANPNPTL